MVFIPHCDEMAFDEVLPVCVHYPFTTTFPVLVVITLSRMRFAKLSDSVLFAQFLRNLLCFLICPELSDTVFFICLSPLVGHGTYGLFSSHMHYEPLRDPIDGMSGKIGNEVFAIMYRIKPRWPTYDDLSVFPYFDHLTDNWRIWLDCDVIVDFVVIVHFNLL